MGVKRRPMRLDIVGFKSYKQIGEFKLRKINESEIQQLFGIKNRKIDSKGNITLMTVLHNSIDALNFGLVENERYKLFSSKYLVEFPDKTNEYTNLAFIRAFKLFAGGDLFCPVIYLSDAISISFIHPKSTHYPEIYKIKVADLTRIKILFLKLKKLKDNKGVQLILDRFDAAIDARLNRKISYIELVSIIESVVVNEPSELRFRFSLHLSYLLTSLNKKTTFKDAKNIYDVRSKLVHTGKSNKLTDDLYNDVLNKTRLIVSWYVDNHENKDKIFEDICNKLKI